MGDFSVKVLAVVPIEAALVTVVSGHGRCPQLRDVPPGLAM